MTSDVAIAIKCHLEHNVLRKVNYIAARRTNYGPLHWVNDRKYQINSVAVVLVDGFEVTIYTWQEDVFGHTYRYTVAKQFDLTAPDSLDLLTRYCRRFKLVSFVIKLLDMVFPSNWLYDPSLTVVDYGA